MQATRPGVDVSRIAAVWSKREDRYSEERASNTDAQGNTPHRDRLEMYQIGG